MWRAANWVTSVHVLGRLTCLPGPPGRLFAAFTELGTDESAFNDKLNGSLFLDLVLDVSCIMFRVRELVLVVGTRHVVV